ncbi:proline dehydrogenase [Moniliophthora roreri MCA 2997]|uniref:Proline dehydrogenase n=1 Tax=Moniliophthora roreri (strain MCA 2997) TaxID=1381753 RepID=V2WX88_MONRO|nr:proline dehydrogenase [Moniliophthora roreri MCA 2997]
MFRLGRHIPRSVHFRIYPGRSAQRWISTSAVSSTSRLRWRTPALALLGIGGVAAYSISKPIRADDDRDDQTYQPTTSSASFGSLIRSYVVYSMCSVPALVDMAPSLLQFFTSIPVIKDVTEAIVRITFFDQFVGGDTALETVPLLHNLRLTNKGALFAYSIEVDENEATAHSAKKVQKEPAYKRIVNEMIRCIDVAADFEDEVLRGAQTGRRTWVAVKMTALLPDAQSLINLSKYLIDTRSPLPVPFPGCPRASDLDVLYDKKRTNTGPLTNEDIKSLRELHSDLRRICTRASERGVKIILDAEYSWYQPAIDALQLSLMREFNVNKSKTSSGLNIQPLIYGTFQAYLRRTPSHLQLAMKDAQENNYTLGVKLVRGAYHPHEVAATRDRTLGKPSLSISPEEHPPVWSVKEETDKCYDECTKTLIGWINDDIQQSKQKGRGQRIGVLFGTHNWTSSRLILSELVRQGIAKEERGSENGESVVVLGDEVTERLTMGQLYGMNDALSDYLVQRTRSSAPMVIKYVPYGALSEVMPYLSRRAIENKSVLGNGSAKEERIRAGRAIWGKLFG